MNIGNETNITGTTTLNNHPLDKRTYETVTVTISYGGNIYADGAFNVTFGDIVLGYRTINEPITTSDNPSTGDIVGNPWITRGLTTSDIKYNKAYLIQNAVQGMPSEAIIYSNGSAEIGKTFSSNALNQLNSNEFNVSSNYFMLDYDEYSYIIVEIIDFETVEVTVALKSNASFTYESIKSNPQVSVTYKTDDLIPTTAQLTSPASTYINNKYYFVSNGNGTSNVVFSGSIDSLSMVEIVYDGYHYVWLPNQAAANAASGYLSMEFEYKKWYYMEYAGAQTDYRNLVEYNGPCPIDSNTFTAGNQDGQDYIDRVIASFDN